MVSKEKYML